jgi:hypothetical protein
MWTTAWLSSLLERMKAAVLLKSKLKGNISYCERPQNE